MKSSHVLDTADVVVVGAGISGLTTAYELRRRGFDVVLMEQRFPAFGASGRNSGAMWLQSRRPGLELELARAGRDMYRQYAEELSDGFDFRQDGGLFFFETDQQASVMEAYVKDRIQAGLDVRLVDREEAESLSALLPDTAIGGVFCPEDAQIDPQKFVRALTAACINAGVRKYENTAVLSTIRQGQSVLGVRTVRGDVHGAGIVWATGAWSVNLLSEGINLPLTTARQGQMVTEPVPVGVNPILRGPRGVAQHPALTSLPEYEAGAFGVRGAPDSGAGVAGPVDFDDTIAQGREGSLYVGSSIDSYGSLNPHIGMAATQSMVSGMVERYTEWTDLGVTGLWAGLTVATPDRLPIVDKVDRTYVNTGHEWGVASGPICGRLTAELVANEPLSISGDLSLHRETLVEAIG
jgi:glycine/D-amino acid oxidase-like deaminating enzyme